MFYFMLLRILSFCLDKVALESKPTTDYTLLNYIFYIFYPTFVFPSMFISFQNFVSCRMCHRPSYQPQVIVRRLLQIIVSGLSVELVLHTTSTFMIHNYYKQVALLGVSVPSLVMTLMLKGGTFASKYICFYGTSALVNEFVGMKIGKLPRCVFLIHTNREMWRHFDTGIYDFIKK